MWVKLPYQPAKYGQPSVVGQILKPLAYITGLLVHFLRTINLTWLNTNVFEPFITGGTFL